MTSNSRNPVVLGVDTSGTDSSVALCNADTVLAKARLAADECRGEALGTLVEGLLEAGFIDVADLAGIAVVVGPGSYTGLRVGLALTRGLALIDRLPVVPFGSLELLALAAPATDPRLRSALISAGRGKFYAAQYEVDGYRADVVSEPCGIDADELPGFLDAGFGDSPGCLCVERALVARLPENLAASLSVVDSARAAVAAHAAIGRLAAGGGIAAERALPLYVGGSNAQPNRNRVVRNDAVLK